MKKISEWNDRTINTVGTIAFFAFVMLLMFIANWADTKYNKAPGEGPESSAVVDSTSQIGTSYIDTLGVATLNPDAVIPVGALREPDITDDVYQWTTCIYPMTGESRDLVWYNTDVGLLSYWEGTPPGYYSTNSGYSI